MGSILLYLALLAAPATTQAADDQTPSVIVAVGAVGTDEYGKEFATWADRWAAAAGLRGAAFTVVGRDSPSADGPDDKQRLKDAILKEPPDGARPLWVVLIGHGTYDGKEGKFNLRGPDVSDAELADWLKPVRRPVAVIDCSSASASFLNRLAGKGRVVVTATRSGSENSFARFGDYLSAAIADPAADLDKDGQTSLLEAFLAASHRTAEFYKQNGRLASEHALLDDNGDGLGVSADWFDGLRATRSARDGSPVDGPRARQWHLLLSPGEQAMPPDRRARRDELELAIETLRAKKKTLGTDAYYAQLETLLVELAGTYEPVK